MKGAIAEPLLKKINMLRSNRLMMIGKSQNFFLALRNPQMSRRKSIFVSSAIHLVGLLHVFSLK